MNLETSLRILEFLFWLYSLECTTLGPPKVFFTDVLPTSDKVPTNSDITLREGPSYASII